jgi:hypothetical protein
MTTRLPVIAMLTVMLATLAACGATDDGHAPAEADRLEHDGVSIALPPGWDGRVLALDYPAAVLQAANFELLPPGETELPPGEQDPIKAMTAQHAVVSVFPCGLLGEEQTARPAPELIVLEELRFASPGDARVPRGHALAQGSFQFAGRCLRIEADFGTESPTPALRIEVDEVLATLSVARA